MVIKKMDYLGMLLRFWESVMYLCGVRHSFQPFPDALKRLCDQVGRALIPHAKHHGRADIKCVPFPLEMTGTTPWNHIPAHSISF